jgi:hypothetical protein
MFKYSSLNPAMGATIRSLARLAPRTLEAYRREEISQGKLRDLSALLSIPADELLALADAA